jgi:hypothetical protein
VYMKLFCEAAIWLNVKIHPNHAYLLSNFSSFVGLTAPTALLMALPLFFPGLICGFLTGNVICWLIPVARRAMEMEAAGDRKVSFAGSNAELLKFGGIASGICMVLSLIGAMAFSS